MYNYIHILYVYVCVCIIGYKIDLILKPKKPKKRFLAAKETLVYFVTKSELNLL